MDKQISSEDLRLLIDRGWQCWTNEHHETFWISPYGYLTGTDGAVAKCRADVDGKNKA